MLLYIVRHGDADTEAMSDDARVLSKKGIKVTTEMAELLADSKFEPPDVIVTSPLPRAEQTARIMAEGFAPEARFEINDGLRAGTSLDVAMSVVASKEDKAETLMIVGHDPTFSHLASVLVSGADYPTIEMKKSAVAIFELTRFDVPRVRGVLRALIPPAILS
jgi:phosphohistidine phosphatase